MIWKNLKKISFSLRFSGEMVEVGGFNERNLPISNEPNERDEKSSEKPLLDRDSFHTEFDTNAYLKVKLS